MSDQHIPIPEGWLDPQFKGGEPAPTVSGQLPIIVLPAGAGGGQKQKPAGAKAAAQVAGRMAAPIPAPQGGTGDFGLVMPGVGGGTYGKPLGSAAGSPIIHAGDSWFQGLNTSANGPGVMFQADWSLKEEVPLPTPREDEGEVLDEPLFPPIHEPTLPSDPPEVPPGPLWPSGPITHRSPDPDPPVGDKEEADVQDRDARYLEILDRLIEEARSDWGWWTDRFTLLHAIWLDIRDHPDLDPEVQKIREDEALEKAKSAAANVNRLAAKVKRLNAQKERVKSQAERRRARRNR